MKEDNQNSKGFIPLHGGYKNLITYQKYPTNPYR